MAAPTAVVEYDPNYVIDVSGTDVDAGNNDYSVNYNYANFQKGFSIVTGTLTAMTVTVLGSNKDGVVKDLTQDLFNVSALASDVAYGANVPLPFKTIIIRAARTNATNAVAFTVFFPKK